MMRYQFPPAAKLALSDNERLVVGCLRVLARRVADRARDLDDIAARELVDREVRDVIDSLGACADNFAQETERYLRQAIRAACAH